MSEVSRSKTQAPAIFLVAAATILGAVLSWWAYNGTEDQLPASMRVERIIPFAPNLVEALFALGHGEKVIAVPEYTVWPEAASALPRVGGILDPSLERIAALRPDLLLLQGDNRELRRFALNSGIQHADVHMDLRLNSIFRGIIQLDSLATGGNGSEGMRLVSQMQASLQEISDSAGAEEEMPRTLLVLGRPPGMPRDLFVPGRQSFLHELLEVAGADSWSGQHDRAYAQVSTEAILADPPQLIIEVRPGEAPRDVQELQSEWEDIGLDDPRVVEFRFNGAMIPGPRVVETARRLRALILG